jgi:hypothetical protein
VQRCITEGCRRVVLDADLHDFVDQGHSAVRVPDVDDAGHLFGSAPGTLPITITRARVEGGTWWLVAETKASDDRQCQYLSVFPDVPTVSRPGGQDARASR